MFPDIGESRQSSLTKPASRPHVMFVISSLTQGGAQTQLVYIASALARKGWTVTVLLLQSYAEDAFRKLLERDSVQLLVLNARTRRWILATSLKRSLQVVWRQRPDVLVGFLYHGIMAARLIGRMTRVPVVVSSIRNERLGRREEILIRLTDWLSDATTTMSANLALGLSKRGIVHPLRLHVIPNMVPDASFISAHGRLKTRVSLKITPDQFLWLAIGGLRSQKDYPNLLRAFSVAADSFPFARLAIAGTGELRDQIDDLVQRLNLSKKVHVLGLRSDVPMLYQACDAFVLSSAWEGMPNVVLEAMISKRPLVATAVGSVREMVVDGESGYIVPPNDQFAMSEAMARMMNLDNLTRQRFVEAGYKRACSEFGMAVIVEKWERLFVTLIRRHLTKRSKD